MILKDISVIIYRKISFLWACLWAGRNFTYISMNWEAKKKLKQIINNSKKQFAIHEFIKLFLWPSY